MPTKIPTSCSALTVGASTLSGTVTIPPSKSQSLRAVLFASLAKGQTRIQGLLDSPDMHAMIAACRQVGAEIVLDGVNATITGVAGRLAGADGAIDVGNSGLVLRFFSAVAALGKEPMTLTGDHSIQTNRPMGELLHGLRQLGAQATSLRSNGYAPVTIEGPICAGSATIDGRDSQPVSALLIAAALSSGTYELKVENPGELPWVALTLEWLQRFGVHATNDRFQRYTVVGAGHINGFEYAVPGDLSSCAFPIAGALVTGSRLTINNVDLSDSQGDKKLFDVFRAMGAKIEEDASARRLTVEADRPLCGTKVDINAMVDGIVALAVVACYAEGKTTIHNGAVAREKECDRIAALASELRKMGADIVEQPDGLVIMGAPLHGAVVKSYSDHRMAMGLALAGLGATGTTQVCDVDCMRKTYPQFVEAFRAVGAQIEECK